MQFHYSIFIVLSFFIFSNQSMAQEQNKRVFLEEFQSIESTYFILYYTPIKENIFHPKSMFYVDTTQQKNSLNDAINELPSISAILVNDQRQMLARINFSQVNNESIITIEEYESGKDYIEISKNNKIPAPRAEELKSLNYSLKGSIQDMSAIHEELNHLNQQHQLYSLKPSNSYIPTQNEINDAFLYYSVEFIKNNQNNVNFWEEKCYEWAKKGYEFGVNEINVLFLIFEYLNPTLPMTEELKDCIVKGFNEL